MDLSLMFRGADGFVELAFAVWSSISLGALLWIRLEESAAAQTARHDESELAPLPVLPVYAGAAAE